MKSKNYIAFFDKTVMFGLTVYFLRSKMTNLYRMNYKILSKVQKVTLDVMKPHWAFKNFGLLGDSIVAFRGKIDVKREELIDLFELKRKSMLPDCLLLNFIVEHFGDDLGKAILRQRVLLSIAEEKIAHRIEGRLINRLGDDLFVQDRKLSITAVTVNPVSSKIHTGICISSSEKCKFIGLKELNIDVDELSEVIVAQYRADMHDLKTKEWRMRPVF